MGNDVSFFLNGKSVTAKDPSPHLLLVDYLRSPAIGLTGTKKPCGQGGCGGCTVILTENDGTTDGKSRAINACLRPVCSLAGLSVTTIEGTGSPPTPDTGYLSHTAGGSRGAALYDAPVPPAIAEAMATARAENSPPATLSGEDDVSYADMEADLPMNPVAYRLAQHNGSQCGYCSVGFVMNMSEFVKTKPERTEQEIEDIFDGNLCRCTGYRTILSGMKTFATPPMSHPDEIPYEFYSNSTPEPNTNALPKIHFVKPEDGNPSVVTIVKPGTSATWHTSLTSAELATLMNDKTKTWRLVHGNTSFGIYKDEFLNASHLIDIRHVKELNAAPVWSEKSLTVSAGTSYSDLIATIEKQYAPPKKLPSSIEAIRYMARRTAGRIVRNAASLGGNAMLVLQHIAKGTGEPFPSDLFTALYAINATVTFKRLGTSGFSENLTKTVEQLTDEVSQNPSIASELLLVSFSLPISGEDKIYLAQKVALREVNSHSIINAATFFEFGANNKVSDARVVFGGIEPCPWRVTQIEPYLKDSDDIKAAMSNTILFTALESEISRKLKEQRDRFADLPTEGFTEGYREQLAVAFLYKALIHAINERGIAISDKEKIASSGKIPWGKWGVSRGVQKYEKRAKYEPVGKPIIKTSALYQASGNMRYTQELPVPPLTVNGAFVQSRKALATFSLKTPKTPKIPEKLSANVADLRAHLKTKFGDPFVDYVSHEDISGPSQMNLQGMGMDQPIFAKDMVNYYGQSIGLVLAHSEQQAAAIATYVSRECISYKDVTWPATYQGFPTTPILTIQDAITHNSIFPDAPASAIWPSHIWKITREGSDLEWVNKDRRHTELRRDGVPVGGQTCLVVASSQMTGGQAHFYMETQACIAEPLDEGRIKIRPSSQSPMEMHQTAAMALGMHYNDVEVEVAPLGGGFGGKTEQARFVTGAAAVAADKLKRPVRVAMPRDEDTAMIGKRHAYFGQCEVAIDTATKKIHGFHSKMWGDGGAFYDCSFIVSNCIQLRADNAYNVKNFESVIDVCRTNTAPSTAMRAFGDIQGKNIIENAIEDAAIAAGLKPHEVREENFYKNGDKTPFGQTMEICYIKDVWDYLKETCNFEDQLAAVEKFNNDNKWRKRGISILPVKYGSGYNLVQLEQATAVLSVNQADGTVTIHQGGIEMGQGLVTQALQVASKVLNIPMAMINIAPVRTSIIPNPSSSGASTGTPYACEVIKQTCEALVKKLNDFMEKVRAELESPPKEKKLTAAELDKRLSELGINYWKYQADGGWSVKDPNKKDDKLIWQNIVKLAYGRRFDFVTAFTAPLGNKTSESPIKSEASKAFKAYEIQPKIPRIELHEYEKPADIAGGVDQFVGFTYSAAYSVAEVDILTGESKIIRSDIVYDMGWSVNPAIDIGQVEGAFIQGVGFLTSENLVFEGNDSKEAGRLNTVNTWRYKIPAHCSIPLEFNVHLFPGTNKDVEPKDATSVYSAKEVGEPPLVLANTVFFAIKAAIRASRIERKVPDAALFRLDAPATPQEIRKACAVDSAELKNSIH